MLFWGSSKNLCPRWMQGKMQTVTIPTVNYLCRPLMPRKKAYLVGFFMPTQHSVPQCPVPSVSGPFSAGEHWGGRGWKQGNWDQSVSHCHYQFCPDNTSTFHFHPRKCGEAEGGPLTEAVARAGDDGHENELLFSPLHWVDGRKCGVISCQSLAPGQEDIHAEVRPATFLLLISLLNKRNRQDRAACYTQLCNYQRLSQIHSMHCGANVWMVTYVGNYSKKTQFG